MAARKKYDPDFKRTLLARLASESVSEVSKATKVPSNLIYVWANKAGMNLAGKVAKKVGKVAKKKTHHANGNGASVSRDPLAAVERELTAALEGIRKVRAAMATVFGAQ